MKHILALTISAASLALGCMGMPDSNEPCTGEAAESLYIGTANPPFPINYLNVRSGPGTSYPRLRQIPRGQYISVECWTTGERVSGTTRWYQLSDGGFVSEAGVSISGVPECRGFGFMGPG